MASETKGKVVPVKVAFTCISPRDEEAQSRAPIILQAGLASINRTYNGVKYELGRRTRRKVYTLNLRNHGDSDWSDDFSLEHMIADLKLFMDSENIPKAVLVGHSLGGRVTMGFALKYPEMVEKLVVEDMSLKTTEANRKAFLKSFAFARILWHTTSQLPRDVSDTEAQNRLKPLVRTFWPKINFDHLLPIHKDEFGKFVWDMNMGVILDLENHLELIEIDLSNNPVYSGDTLILAGDKSDVRAQDDIEDIRKYFLNTDYEVIENGFHTYHLEQPQRYIHVVSKFIKNKEL